MKRILAEPLLHFVVLGVGLFVLHRFITGEAPSVGDEIVVDAPRVAALAEQFERSWRRAPTATELDGLVESYVRDEVLYREGVALGLDRDDAVIRSRIRLKMEVIGDGAAGEITEAQVKAWFDAHRSRYAKPAYYDVRQVFFDPAKHRAARDVTVDDALRRLQSDPDLDFGTLGDQTLLPGALEGVTQSDLASQFGEAFAAGAAQAPVGRWLGPVKSAYGEHLVRVDLREEEEAAELSQVREAVERDLRYARDQQARDAHYQELRARYTVRVEMPGAGAAAIVAEQRAPHRAAP